MPATSSESVSRTIDEEVAIKKNGTASHFKIRVQFFFIFCSGARGQSSKTNRMYTLNLRFGS